MLQFKEAGSGLCIGVPPWAPNGKKPERPPELTGFVIAGEDQKWVWAKARIEGNTVAVWSDEVKKPVAVRYCWGGYPRFSLYNKEGLPAFPFRTDNCNVRSRLELSGGLASVPSLLDHRIVGSRKVGTAQCILGNGRSLCGAGILGCASSGQDTEKRKYFCRMAPIASSRNDIIKSRH